VTTDNSIQNSVPRQVKPFSPALQHLFKQTPIANFTSEELLLIIKEVIRCYTSEFVSICSSFDNHKQLPGSIPAALNKGTQCFLLCAISRTEISEVLLFITANEQFFRYEIPYQNAQDSNNNSQEKSNFSSAEFITDEEVRKLLGTEPDLCYRIVSALHSASQAKIESYSALTEKFRTIRSGIEVITSGIQR
jgi:hypothetical protein